MARSRVLGQGVRSRVGSQVLVEVQQVSTWARDSGSRSGSGLVLGV